MEKTYSPSEFSSELQGNWQECLGLGISVLDLGCGKTYTSGGLMLFVTATRKSIGMLFLEYN